MHKINWKLVLVIIILVAVLVILIIIKGLMDQNHLKDTQQTLVNPVLVPNQQACKTIRTPCNPDDASSCDKSCTEEELKCINLDGITPTAAGRAINGGGYVCLPEIPSLECDIDNGGVYVWTGYGFTDDQTWDCYCMYPEYFGGTACKLPNPGVCNEGTLSSPEGKEPTALNCTCPEGTMLLQRALSNTPYCESTDPAKGGGMFGLAGDLHTSPDWRNVLFRGIDTAGGVIAPRTTQEWATSLVEELAASYSPDDSKSKNMVSTLQAFLDAENSKCASCEVRAACSDHCNANFMTNLTQDLANKVCEQLCPNACTSVCNCSGKAAVWSSKISALGNKMWYTYDPVDLPPEPNDACTSNFG